MSRAPFPAFKQQINSVLGFVGIHVYHGIQIFAISGQLLTVILFSPGQPQTQIRRKPGSLRLILHFEIERAFLAEHLARQRRPGVIDSVRLRFLGNQVYNRSANQSESPQSV